MAWFTHTPLKRVNSIGLVFSNESPSQELTRIIIFEKTETELEDINVVQFLRDRVIVKFFDSSVYEKYVDLYEGKIWQFGNIKVKCTDESSSITYVSIRDCPPEMDSSILVNVLSQYGSVEGLRYNRYKYGPFQGALNGIRTAKMHVKKNIPSKITINNVQIHLIYNGQKRTCFKCGSEFHEAKECSTEFFDRTNIFSTTDFPLLNKDNREEVCNDNTGENEVSTTPSEQTKVEKGKGNITTSQEEVEKVQENETSDNAYDELQLMDRDTTSKVIVTTVDVHASEEGNYSIVKEVQGKVVPENLKGKKKQENERLDEDIRDAPLTPSCVESEKVAHSPSPAGQGGGGWDMRKEHEDITALDTFDDDIEAASRLLACENIDFGLSMTTKDSDMECAKGNQAMETGCDDDTVKEKMMDNKKDSSKRAKHDCSSDDEEKQGKLMKHKKNM